MFSIVTKLYHAFRHSCCGLIYAWRTQSAFRLELLLLLITIPAAFYFSQSSVQLILMISSIILLLIVELLNSAIETTINRISLEYHELSKYAKDIASAAVLIACVNAVTTWGIILLYSDFH